MHVDMVRHLNVPLEESEFAELKAWKEKWELIEGHPIEWGELLLLQARRQL